MTEQQAINIAAARRPNGKIVMFQDGDFDVMERGMRVMTFDSVFGSLFDTSIHAKDGMEEIFA